MALSLKNHAYDYIWKKLASGDIAFGARLSDIHLAKEIGISRTPVREALILLETQGLVEQTDGAGPRVKNPDRRELDEWFTFREMLESAATARAATHIANEALAELNGLCAQYLAAARQVRDEGVSSVSDKLGERLVILDMAFHLVLMRAAQNRPVLRAVSDLHVLGRILRRRAELPSVSLLRRSALVYRDHRRIVKALERRDAVAAGQAMTRHLLRARVYHLDAFDWQQRRQSAEGTDLSDLPPHVQSLLADMEAAEASTKPSTKTKAIDHSTRKLQQRRAARAGNAALPGRDAAQPRGTSKFSRRKQS